jgi:cell division protein ZipA
MEQLSIRDWMIIIGGMMIAGVLIDAVRRYWRERRAELKLNARLERASPGEEQPFNLLTELPNGGARIIRRGDLGEGLEQDEWEPLDDQEQFDRADGSLDGTVPDPIDVAVAAEAKERLQEVTPSDEAAATGRATEQTDQTEQTEQTDQTEQTGKTEPLAVPGDVAAPAEGSRRRTVKPVAASDGAGPNRESSDGGTVDWLESIEKHEPDLPEQGRLPRGPNTHVFILYVVARREEAFAGATILETLLANDLRFGDMDFFHRHERTSGRGAIEFSVANMMKPGVFDIDNMEPLQTRGLMFFVTLPGPTDMLKAFDYMYETAKLVAKSLDGDIQDETRSVVTRQSLEHMRQQIRELERRLLVRRT